MGQRLTTKDERPPSVSSRRAHGLLPTASGLSYIPRPMTRKGGRLLFDLSEYHWCIHADILKPVSMPPQAYLFSHEFLHGYKSIHASMLLLTEEITN